MCTWSGVDNMLLHRTTWRNALETCFKSTYWPKSFHTLGLRSGMDIPQSTYLSQWAPWAWQAAIELITFQWAWLQLQVNETLHWSHTPMSILDVFIHSADWTTQRTSLLEYSTLQIGTVQHKQGQQSSWLRTHQQWPHKYVAGQVIFVACNVMRNKCTYNGNCACLCQAAPWVWQAPCNAIVVDIKQAQLQCNHRIHCVNMDHHAARLMPNWYD